MDARTGRLSSPGEHAARARVEAVYRAVDRLSPSDLNEIPVPPVDLDDRDARIEALERLADGAGRRPLLDDARAALANAILARFADIRPYPYGINPTGSARVEDQAAVVTALRDLVAVAVMQDRLEPEDARALARPGLHLLGSRVAILDDHAWADLARDAEAPDGTVATLAGAPTEADWAAAAEQARTDRVAALQDGYVPPGTRIMRRGLVGVVAAAGVIGAVAWGLAEDDFLLGLLVAAAVVALGWTFATWSPRRR